MVLLVPSAVTLAGGLGPGGVPSPGLAATAHDRALSLQTPPAAGEQSSQAPPSLCR